MSLGKTSSKSSSTQSLAQNPNQDVLAGNAGNVASWAAQPAPSYAGPALDLSGSIGAATSGTNFYAPNVSTADRVSKERLDGYMNPYLSDVVDSTQADWMESRNRAMNETKAQALASTGFGTGARRYVREGVVEGEYDRNIGSVIGGLKQGGWNTALQAGQTDLARLLTADTANQSAAVQSAQVRAQNAALLGQLQTAQYGAGYDDFVRQREEDLARRQIQNQAYSMLYSGPMTTQTGKSSGFNIGIPQAPR